MSTFNLNNASIKKLAIENPNLSNKDFYIRYLYDLCESENEKAVIYKVINNALQNNSVIRIRNFFIKNGEATKDKRKECKEKQEEIREEFSKQGLFDGIARWFKKF